jgi:hypothetical protein
MAHRPSALPRYAPRSGATRAPWPAARPAAGPPGTIRATRSSPAARLPATIFVFFLAWDLYCYYPVDKVLLIFSYMVGMGFERLAETEAVWNGGGGIESRGEWLAASASRSRLVVCDITSHNTCSSLSTNGQRRQHVCGRDTKP